MITEIGLEFYLCCLYYIFYKPENYFYVTITSTYSQS